VNICIHYHFQEDIVRQEGRPKHDVAEILREYLPAYLKDHKLSPRQFKVAKAILACRTAALGGHKRECDNDGCDYADQSYNSCGDRHCPKCQGIAKNKWLKKRLVELLPTGYFHVVFTIPALLNAIAIHNKSLFYNILFRAASDTLKAFGRDPAYLGGEMGFLATLHTWGQTMIDHPHLHVIVPEGGVSVGNDGKEKWVEIKKKGKYLFPKKAMANLFRGKLIGALKNAYQKGKLKLPDNQAELSDHRLFELFIDQVVNRRWNVYAKQPFASPAEVMTYIGRYTHRVAISNYRILSIGQGNVTFEYKDYKDNATVKSMTLTAGEFIRRFLLHVLPSGYHKIRMYGFWANGNRAENIDRVRKLILRGQSIFDFKDEMIEKLLKTLSEFVPDQCQKCGEGIMIKTGGIAPKGYPYIPVADTS
jgi:hypothetical protein